MLDQFSDGLPFVSQVLTRRRHEQERLLTEQQTAVAIARLEAMFETPVAVPALPAPAVVVEEIAAELVPVRREPIASRRAKASRPMKICPDCVETIVETARSCPFCLYDFDHAVSAWPVARGAAA